MTPRAKQPKSPLPKSGPASAKAAPSHHRRLRDTRLRLQRCSPDRCKETTARVQEMHQAIAAKSFDVPTRIPVISQAPPPLLNWRITPFRRVYAIHHGTEGVPGVAAVIERNLPASEGNAASNRTVSSVRSAFECCFWRPSRRTGQCARHRHGHLLRWPPDCHRQCRTGCHLPGQPPQTVCIHPRTGLRRTLLATGRQEWRSRFGQALLQDFGYTFYLRYNSGLPIADNGARLRPAAGSPVAAPAGTSGRTAAIGCALAA